MNISLSSPLFQPFVPLQQAPVGAAINGNDAKAEATINTRPVGAASETEGTQTGRRGDPKSADKQNGDEQAKPIEGSEEAKRAALKDPTSELFKELQQLKERDREVRTHEQAHLAAAGQHARGGPVYEFERGPDGRRYAVGGHVNIDTSKVAGDPEATLRKADVIRRAALAPAEPSPQDRRVAAQASSMAVEARQEIAQLRLEEAKQKPQPDEESKDSATTDGKPIDNSRGELEGKIRATGAVDAAAPLLDLVA